ncbi:IS4 family transposase, partial [Roseateles sp.]|uniref:IS4 family transposase n=1 Tax=Roseateles sp. TaxID=1971397 RepID=UPI003BA7E0BC
LSLTHNGGEINCTLVWMVIFGRVPTHSQRPLPTSSCQSSSEANARWAHNELGSIELGDSRRNRRMVKAFSQMLNAPGASIPQCSSSLAQAKAFYRLLNVETLTDTLLFEVQRQAVLRRAQASGCRVLLAIQDTTTCNFDSHHSLDGLGAICSNRCKSGIQGLHVHSTLLSAADEDAVFGLLGAKLYAREVSRQKQAPGTRNRERIQDKESIRWLESLALAREARQWLRQPYTEQGAGTTAPLILSVGDREADIYELLVEAQQHRDENLGLLVRAQHNRTLADEEETRLWQHLASSQPAGSLTLQLPRSQGQQARQVTLSVRFSSVTIAVPAHKAKYLKMDTPVNASVVELREEGGIEGKGICWRLLSTLGVETLEAAVQLARWYAKRWQIEEFHRILKTGCRVEARQMRSLERLKPMMALDMMVACRIMGMSAAARQRPEDPATDWLDEDEIRALEAYENAGEKPNAADKRLEKAPSMRLGAAVRSIGRLGGHLGRKGDGHPGAQVLWQGLAKLDIITEVWRRLRHPPTCG